MKTSLEKVQVSLLWNFSLIFIPRFSVSSPSSSVGLQMGIIPLSFALYTVVLSNYPLQSSPEENHCFSSVVLWFSSLSHSPCKEGEYD